MDYCCLSLLKVMCNEAFGIGETCFKFKKCQHATFEKATDRLNLEGMDFLLGKQILRDA